MSMTVADLMTHDVVTVTPETSFRDAVRLLEDRRVDTLPVVAQDGRVVGVLTASDLLLKEEISEGPRGVPGLPWQRRRDRARGAGTTVEKCMSTDLVTVAADATFCAAARLMHRHHVGGLPVVDRAGRLQGIVTRSDLLTVYLRDDAELQEEVTAAMPPGIEASVAEGRAVLTGHVDLRSTAVHAQATAQGVAGVVDVDCRVRYEADDVDVMLVGP